MRVMIALAVAASVLACASAFAQAPAPAPAPVPAAADTWTVKQGDTLVKIATDRYGHAAYAEVLALYNNVDPTKLKVGQVVKTPDLRAIAKEEKLIPTVGDEVDAMLKAREAYLPLVPKLIEFRKTNEHPAIPPDMKKDLLAGVALIDKAADGLAAKKEGVVEVPKKMIGQLRSIAAVLLEISDGQIDENGYNVEEVNQRVALALVNGIKWARNGFK